MNAGFNSVAAALSAATADVRVRLVDPIFKGNERFYVLDTNVLLFDPKGFIQSFGEHHVVIPGPVLDELDGQKHHPQLGFFAREAVRRIVEAKNGSNLLQGVVTSGGGTLRVSASPHNFKKLPAGFQRNHDGLILLTVQELQERHPGRDVVLVSKDLYLRVKAEAMGLLAEDYRCGQSPPMDQMAVGYVKQQLTKRNFARLLHEHRLPIHDVCLDSTLRIHPNAGFLFSDETDLGHSALAIYMPQKGYFYLVHQPPHSPDRKSSDSSIVSPRDSLQALAYALAVHPDIDLLTLVGPAGSGKTLIALKAALALLDQPNSKYRHIIVFRPNQEMGRAVGFLPGSLSEKTAPWVIPIQQALRRLGDPERFMDDEGDKKRGVSVQIINAIQGTTYPGYILIIDEGQNFSPLEIRAIITRAGAIDGVNTKVIVTGDPDQVTHPVLDKRSNGLVHVVDRFIGPEVKDFSNIYAHVAFEKVFRSRLAEVAARRL